MAGGKTIDPKAGLSDKLRSMNAAMAAGEVLPSGEEGELEEGEVLVQFEISAIAVLEDVGKVPVKLLRIGDISKTVKFPPFSLSICPGKGEGGHGGWDWDRGRGLCGDPHCSHFSTWRDRAGGGGGGD